MGSLDQNSMLIVTFKYQSSKKFGSCPVIHISWYLDNNQTMLEQNVGWYEKQKE